MKARFYDPSCACFITQDSFEGEVDLPSSFARDRQKNFDEMKRRAQDAGEQIEEGLKDEAPFLLLGPVGKFLEKIPGVKSFTKKFFKKNKTDKVGDVGSGAAAGQTAATSWKKATVLNRTVYKNNKLIDPLKVDRKGRTNVERMKQGLAPVGPDGKSIELHHTVQQEITGFNGKRGPLAEVSRQFHSDNYDAIHVYHRNHPDYISWRKLHPDQAKEYDAYRTAYWIERAKDFE